MIDGPTDFKPTKNENENKKRVLNYFYIYVFGFWFIIIFTLGCSCGFYVSKQIYSKKLHEAIQIQRMKVDDKIYDITENSILSLNQIKTEIKND